MRASQSLELTDANNSLEGVERGRSKSCLQLGRFPFSIALTLVVRIAFPSVFPFSIALTEG